MISEKLNKHWMFLISQVVLYFLIYSLMGWAWETVYCSISAGHYVPRGFLYGPFCPVYGFGVLLVLYLVHPYVTKNVFVLFLISACIVTVLEYCTGLALEKFFHLRLWDYSDYMFNVSGLICLPVSIFWGLGCVAIVKVVHPKVELLVNYLYSRFGWGLTLIVIAVFTSDTILSILKAFKNRF